MRAKRPNYDNGFKSDAVYFDLIAKQSLDRTERAALRKVASTYKALAATWSILHTRREQWLKRAEECRTLADRFSNEVCRAQLLRLADSYDILAASDFYTA